MAASKGLPRLGLKRKRAQLALGALQNDVENESNGVRRKRQCVASKDGDASAALPPNEKQQEEEVVYRTCYWVELAPRRTNDIKANAGDGMCNKRHT